MHTSPLDSLRTSLRVLLAFALIAGLTMLVQPGKAQVSDPPPDQVAVKLRLATSINTILARYNASLLATVPETRLYILRLLGGQTAAALLPVLNSDPDLHYAEPNYYADSAPGGGEIMFRAHMAPLAGEIMFRAHGDLTATPPNGSDQWAWIKVGLPAAQPMSSGQSIIVAVLDTGLAPDHPLLRANLTAGYDFVGMTNDIYDTGNGLDDDGDGQADEDVGHGTHVSGIIVTEAPGVQIMPIRVLNSDGVGTYWEVAAGIRYAVDHGAKVINMSLSAPRLTGSLAEALAYAASHGVIVVAAAGGGTDPNYPAGYADKWAVLGTGATDQADAVAWFSGGQPADTDIFAPGVEISSAFPYNGYALGSGTSMAAPMVAGEAALLWSRHPDWSTAEIAQRIAYQASPVVGSTARRIDLVAALSTGLEVDHAHPDLTGSPHDEYILPRLRLFNNTPQEVPLSELTVRYWYTLGPAQTQMFLCDYSNPVPCSSVMGSFVPIPLNSPNRTSLSDLYLEVGFPPGAGMLAAGGQVEMYLRVLKTDLSYYMESNDYSYDDPARPDMTRWSRITVYRNGVLAWGAEPGAGIFTPSPTFVRTATSSATIAAASPTATRSSTPIPPAATLTRTPTRSSTASRTSTRTPTRTSTLAAVTPTPTRTWTRTWTNAPTSTRSMTSTPTHTGLPVSTSTPGSDPCANPTVITGGGSYPVSSAGTCFKLVNPSFKWGAMWSVMNGPDSTVSNTVQWYGGRNEAVTACANTIQVLDGNGAQINNFTVGRDSSGATYVIVTGNKANSVSIGIQNWQNGTGCSVGPTPHP